MSWDWTQIDWKAGWVSLPVTMHAGRTLLKIGGVTYFQLTILLWGSCVCVCVCVAVQIAELLAELADERGTSESASQLLETETSERLRLEKDLKDLQAHASLTFHWEKTVIPLKHDIFDPLTRCVIAYADEIWIHEETVRVTGDGGDGSQAHENIRAQWAAGRRQRCRSVQLWTASVRSGIASVLLSEKRSWNLQLFCSFKVLCCMKWEG